MMGEEMVCGKCGAWWPNKWIVGEASVGLFSRWVVILGGGVSRKYLSAYH